MKPMKVAEARAKFGEILDEAEKGAAVVIERRGVRFRLTAEAAAARPAAKAASPFKRIDPAVMAGQWSWTSGDRGLRFAAGRKGR